VKGIFDFWTKDKGRKTNALYPSSHQGGIMFDLRLIREQPDRVREALRRRGDDATRVDAILAVDEERRKTLAELEALRNQRNTMSKEIGKMKDDAAREAKKAQVREINARSDVLEKSVSEIETRLNDLLAVMPNLPDDDVPLGKADSENVIVKTVG